MNSDRLRELLEGLDLDERIKLATLLRRMGYVPRAHMKSYARVELMGHNVVYGEVTEVTFAGVTWVSVTGDKTTKLYNTNAIYALEPLDEKPEPLSHACRPTCTGRSQDCNMGRLGGPGDEDCEQCIPCACSIALDESEIPF